MRHGFRQSIAWLHTWVGLLVGWMLFSIFITGSATYYKDAITQWMQAAPLAAKSAGDAAAEHPASRRLTDDALVHQAVTILQEKAPHAARWFISMPGLRGDTGHVSWQDDKTGFQSAPLSPLSDFSQSVGTPTRKTLGGDLFYDFHFQLYYVPPLVGRWIVSFCAMFMLVAIISGIITHRRIFKDFFTFRPHKGQRSWLDAHNISAVLALPYHLMITYTGLATLCLMLFPWGVAPRYPGPNAQGRFIAEAYDFAPAAKASGIAAPLTDVATLLQTATKQFDGHAADTIVIDQPGDAAAQIKVVRGSTDRISVAPESVTFNGVNGKVIRTHLRNGPASNTTGFMFGIHEAAFAPWALRVFLFLSGLTGALMIASGLVMWANKHRQKQTKDGRIGLGTRVVEHLNVTAIAGLPLAMVSYFWANRLLPLAIENRSEWEVRVFFACWGIAALHPFLRRGKAAWLDQLFLAGALFALLPLLDKISNGWWALPNFDLACSGLAALLLTIAVYVMRHRSRPHEAQRDRQVSRAMRTEGHGGRVS